MKVPIPTTLTLHRLYLHKHFTANKIMVVVLHWSHTKKFYG